MDQCLYTVMVGSAYFVKSTPPRAFSISFSILCRHVPHILKMCMNYYNTEKVIIDATGMLRMYMKNYNAEKISLSNFLHV